MKKKTLLLIAVVLGLVLTAMAFLLRPQADMMPESQFLALDGLARAKYVRSLVQKAVECGDEKMAQEYLVRAGALAKHVPQEHIDLLFLKFKAGQYDLDHLRPSKKSLSENVTVLSPRARLVEEKRVEDMPYTGMADNGKVFLSPLPFQSEELLVAQRLEIDGKAVITITEDDGGWKKFHLSPDQGQVAMADWMTARPIEILDLRTQKRLTVKPPREFPGHYNAYPFHFETWAADSRSFRAQVFGSEVKEGGMMSYRETWSVDVATGDASFIKREERPYEQNIRWDQPPAGDTVTSQPGRTP